MILELKGTKVTIVDKTLGYQGDNLVDTIQVTVDKDSTWNYKLDMYKGKSKRFDSVLMVREGNICTVQLTNEILSYGGRYVFQLRGYTDTQTYHSDIFESWVNASIEYQDDCKQGDCECDCKLPTEFYQVEDNVTEINNHPPYPGDNNKWMIWDVDRHEYVESDIEVVGGGGGDYQTKANLTTSITAESTDEQYPSAKATYEYGQSIAQSAGKINAITVNGTAQTVEDKTAKIIVNKSTVGLGNVNNTSDNDKPVSSAQASAIADAKQAGTTAQANLDAHISNKENPHEVTKAQVGLGDVDNTSDVNKPISTATQTALNGKLDKTAVVDVTVEALKGQAADAKSVYDTIQALPTGTDISLGVTGASVGDIIKVKAVDDSGKPTAWEAVTAKLANPNALTFTGAVTGSYDGSEPLSVEIPSGGGSIGNDITITTLASGTIPSGTEPLITHTGITFGQLNDYKRIAIAINNPSVVTGSEWKIIHNDDLTSWKKIAIANQRGYVVLLKVVDHIWDIRFLSPTNESNGFSSSSYAPFLTKFTGYVVGTLMLNFASTQDDEICIYNESATTADANWIIQGMNF